MNRNKFLIFFVIVLSVVFVSQFIDFGNLTPTGYTPYDLSTAIYDNINISAKDTFPTGLFFKPDGTKFYEIGLIGNLIYQYSCSDDWNLSSCSYDNVNISISGIIGTPRDLFFKPDGTRFYGVGDSSNLINQYTCSDAWNLSSCSNDNVNISTQDTSPMGLFFKPDGIKLYEVGLVGDKFYQYTCSDAWNLSSCTYDGIQISTQSIDSTDLFFKPDGTKLYELGLSVNDAIYQYTCSDAWNLSSCTYDSVNLLTQDSNPFSFFIKPDGTKMYEIGTSGKKIYQYSFPSISINLTSPANNSNLSTNNVNFLGNISDPSGLGVINVSLLIDGTVNQTVDYAWNLSAVTHYNINISRQDTSSSDLFFKPDGTRLYEIGTANDLIYQSTCSDTWNLSSCTYDNINISTQEFASLGLFFKPDGTKLYEIGFSNLLIYQSTCSDAWNLSSCTYDSVSISTQDTFPNDLFFKPDGTKLYEIGKTNDLIYQYTCSTQWILSSCTYDNINISTQDTSPTDLFFKPDGTKLYEAGDVRTYQYTCSDVWNLSSCAYDNTNIITHSGLVGLFFKPDGTRLYEIENGGNKIHQHILFNEEIHNFSKALSDGNHNWSIQAYDGNNYLYESINFFTTDSTGPTITFLCDAELITPGETLTCTCSAADSLTGVQSTTYTANPSTATVGTFSTSCISLDNLNNSGTTSWSYIVEAPISGGGVILPAPGEPTLVKTHSIFEIFPGVVTTLSGFAKTGVTSVTFEVNKKTTNVKVKVSKYDSKPTEVSKEVTGRTYRYLQISMENLNENLEKAKVKFEVDKNWFETNNLKTNEVSIFKFDNSTEKWNELDTNFDSEDDNFYYYTIELDSFSFFALGEKIVEELKIVHKTAEDSRELDGKELWVILIILILLTSILFLFLIIYLILQDKKQKIQLNLVKDNLNLIPKSSEQPIVLKKQNLNKEINLEKIKIVNSVNEDQHYLTDLLKRYPNFKRKTSEVNQNTFHKSLFESRKFLLDCHFDPEKTMDPKIRKEREKLNKKIEEVNKRIKGSDKSSFFYKYP